MNKKQPSPLQEYLERVGLRDKYMTHPIRIDDPGLFKLYSLNDDIKRHSIWEVDDSEWGDSGRQFGLGNLVLNHAIHETSLLMKITTFERLMASAVVYGDWNEWCELQDSIEAEYMERSERIEASGKLGYGYVFTTLVADGCAFYIVTKATPKTVYFEHLCFGDNYRNQFVSSLDGKMPRKEFNQMTGFGKPRMFLASRVGYTP